MGRFIIDDCQTLIDTYTRDTYDYVCDVNLVEVLNDLNEKVEKMRRFRKFTSSIKYYDIYDKVENKAYNSTDLVNKLYFENDDLKHEIDDLVRLIEDLGHDEMVRQMEEILK